MNKLGHVKRAADRIKKAKTQNRSFVLPPSDEDQEEIDRMMKGPPTNRQAPYKMGRKKSRS